MRDQGQGKSVQELSGLFGYSRQHFYQQRKRLSDRTKKEVSILNFVREMRKVQSNIGTIKLQYLWNQQDGVPRIGRDALFELLRRNNLLVRRPKKYRPKLTDGDGHPICPDYRKQIPVLDRPNLLWCSDTTYFEIEGSQRWAFLTCVTDEYSHLIVGDVVSKGLRTEQLLPAFQDAFERELPSGQVRFEHPLFIHTDGASQFKSGLYIDLMDRYGVTRSMAGAGKSYENPVAERLNGILKNEILGKRKFASMEEAREAIARAILIYNEQRPHLSCGLQTPAEAHQTTGVLKRMWKQRPGSRHKPFSQKGPFMDGGLSGKMSFQTLK